MVPPLHPVPLAELRLLAEGRQWSVDQRITGLESLTPVRGELRVVHHGNALEINAEAETIVTLRCDRCLQHYNHPLRAEVHELIELVDPPAASGGSREASSGSRDASGPKLTISLAPDGDDLDDRLDSAGRFDPEHWLFEQLSLRLPLVNRCGADCPGPACWSSEAGGADPRWAALERLRGGG